MDSSLWTIDYVLANQNACRDFLEKSENRALVPLLNHIENHAIPNSSLVRFRGMIQDMLDPEFYLEKYSVSGPAGTRMQDGRYRDTIVYETVTTHPFQSHQHLVNIPFTFQDDETLEANSKDNQHGERRSMFVLSVPGVNDWIAEVELELYGTPATQAETLEGPASTMANKRPLDTQDDVMDVDGHVDVSFDPTDPVKRLKTDTSSAAAVQPALNGILSAEYLLNSPIPDRPSKSCLVKVYDDFERYKLNTLVDVIGFVSMDPILDGSQDKLSEIDGIDVEEHISTNPPPSLIPRIHAISIRELSHINPLLDSGGASAVQTDVFKDLHKVLTQVLFGDEVAAHYLFCHLLSSIYARVDVEILGRCALNLSNLPSAVISGDYIRQLYEIIEMLVPASHYFPLTLDSLNTTQFNPKKDFKTNRLTSGLLQLAPHTHLMIDETRLATGQLQSAGLSALGSISQLISNQIVKFDFQFYQLDFEADIPVLVLSEGKSILPSDFHCPLRQADPDAVRIIDETLKAAKQFVRANSREMRSFLTAQKGAPFSLGAGLQEIIQNDLVEMRRDLNMKPDDFHLFLNLSRLVGKSLAKGAADAETWELVKSLEMERRRRVDALPQRKGQQPIES